ncbi:MAG: glycosyltransferase family 2 protein [Treponema sp.]|nr:glycosyltransferase family 2 protein [Treponema sp.]
MGGFGRMESERGGGRKRRVTFVPREPLISVCIPVYNTEPFLAQCLRSVIRQDFPYFEVVLVSDASRGKDQKGRSAKKIVHLMQKECDSLRKAACLPPVKLKLIEHKENRGLIEVRRTLCYEAKAFFMTQLDSDDQLEEGALSSLFNAAMTGVGGNYESGTSAEGFSTGDASFSADSAQADQKSAAQSGNQTGAQCGAQAPAPLYENLPDLESFVDIVHGTSTAGTFSEDGTFTPSKVNRYGKIFYGKIEGRELFRRWFLDGDFTANTWGKLIKRRLWLKAYESIPYTQCNVADDLLLFFFLAQEAKNYLGIQNNVYLYRVDSGMTSHRKIDTIHKWKMVCSTASVFSVLSSWAQEDEKRLAPDELEMLKAMTRTYLLNNIKQMRDRVIPELMEEARSLLCEYWGESFVRLAEEALDKNENKASSEIVAGQ